MNPAYICTETRLRIRLEADEQWSYVHKKRNPRWLWWVENHDTGEIVAFLFGRRTNASFKRLLRLLAESGIIVSRWFTDNWWAYHDLLPTEIHQAGKEQTQSIERKHRPGDPVGLTHPNQAVGTPNNLLFKVCLDA